MLQKVQFQILFLFLFLRCPSARDYYSLNNFIAVSDSSDNPQFAVDSQGQLTLARPLNFENQPSHVIGVLALTDSSPPLTALAEIILQVQDENDHDPQFESNTYVLNLAENVPEGSSIMRGRGYKISDKGIK